MMIWDSILIAAAAVTCVVACFVLFGNSDEELKIFALNMLTIGICVVILGVCMLAGESAGDKGAGAASEEGTFLYPGGADGARMDGDKE